MFIKFIWTVITPTTDNSNHTIYHPYLEMAERHNAKQVIRIAQDLVYKLQDLIENKWQRILPRLYVSHLWPGQRVCRNRRAEDSGS